MLPSDSDDEDERELTLTESAFNTNLPRVSESADSLASNCLLEDELPKNHNLCTKKVTELELKKLNNDQIIRDVNYSNIYMRKHLKLSGKSSRQSRKKSTERVYNNYHCCLYCSRFIQHINTHLMTHRNLEPVRKLLNTKDISAVRKLGDDQNNQKVIAKKRRRIPNCSSTFQ